MAETKEAAVTAFEFFVETYSVKYERAVKKLTKDRDVLLTFYDFPAEHWNEEVSMRRGATLATITRSPAPPRITSAPPTQSRASLQRYVTGHAKTKECLSRKTAMSMVYKLMMSAKKKWRKLDGANQLPEIINGVAFKDGIKQFKDVA